MIVKPLLFDLSKVDVNNVVADLNTIRKHNPQRFEMEQLTAIVYEDETICVGYKDVTANEFWVRGHMPNMPLMPGVVMIEAAAQLCSYFVHKRNLLEVPMIGFGGVDEVRFREPVVPGDRLILVSEMIKVRPRRMAIGRFQGVVRGKVAVEGVVRAVPIPVAALTGQPPDQSAGASQAD